jgi:hypothetical protein
VRVRGHGQPSGLSGSLRIVPGEDPTEGSVLDPDGREVVLLVRIWDEKITRDHPELAGHLDAVLAAVQRPDHVAPDSLPDRKRFYRRDVGPSRWLLAVVSYEQEPARIITALAIRKDPKQWKP